MGAVPEGEVRAFFERLLPSASELALARAAKIHALEAPPAGREGCGDCGYLEKMRGLLG